MSVILEKGLANFFCKGPDVLSHAGHIVLSQPSKFAFIARKQPVNMLANRYGCVPTKLHLWTKM